MNAILRNSFAQMLLLALAYVIVGELAILLLGYSLGYVAPLWPPAGLALGAMLLRRHLWPGVWLGSFLINVDALFASTTLQDTLHELVTHAALGAGATLQAVTGALLIARFIAPDPSLTSEREVGKFMLLAGPVTCLINPTCTLIVLLLTGVLSLHGMAATWASWWMGDILGVYLFAPFAMQWLSQQESWRSRRKSITAALLIMCVAAMLVFGTVNRLASRAARENLEHESSLVTAALQRRIDVDGELVRALTGLFAADEQVGSEEFARFAATLLGGHTEVQALFWVPRAPGPEAMAFPVQYIDARVDTGLRRGLDLGKDPHLSSVIERSMNNGLIGSVVHRQPAHESLHSYVLLAPLYDESLPTAIGVAEHRAHLRGFTGAVVNVDELAAKALADVPGAPSVPWHLDIHSAPASAGASSRRTRDALHEPVMRHLRIADREWLLTFQPTGNYLRSRSQIAALIVLGAGLGFTMLLVAGTLIVTGHTLTIQAEVRARTEELAHINSKLADEVCDHISTEEALERERELLKSVFDNLSEGILVMSAERQVTMANRAAHAMLLRAAGTTAVLELGWETAVRTYASDGSRKLTFDELPIVRALRGETVRDAEVVIGYERRPGVRVLMTAQPLMSAGTQQPGAIAIVRDITDAHKIERLKSEFVSTVSHELRTPLTSIRGSLGLLHSESLADVDKVRRLIELALRNTDRLTFLINDLLDIEKIEQGGMKFDFSEQCLGMLVQQAVDAQQGHAQACNVRIRIEATSAAMCVLVDPQRLLQVLANLLSNAVKFSPPGSEVVVQRTQLNGRCRVAIRDQGPGIAADFRDRLFQKFSQADSSDARTKGGTGLGLAISKALTEHMGGTIGFDGEPGEGATFYIELAVSG